MLNQGACIEVIGVVLALSTELQSQPTVQVHVFMAFSWQLAP